MIEINLLPVGARTTEGTPPKRFGLYIATLIVAGALSVILVRYHFVKIPAVVLDIAGKKIRIAELQKEKAEVEKITAEITTINQKIAVLDNLTLSRVRFARLFDKLTNAMPEGVWLRAFSLANDTSPSKGLTPAGKRYLISLAGYTVGANALERDHKVTELLTSLERTFQIPAENAVPPTPIPEDYGFDKFVGLRFERPRLLGFNEGGLPALANVDPKTVKQLNPPVIGLDFSLTMSFELPAPKGGG